MDTPDNVSSEFRCAYSWSCEGSLSSHGFGNGTILRPEDAVRGRIGYAPTPATVFIYYVDVMPGRRSHVACTIAIASKTSYDEDRRANGPNFD